VNKRDQAAITVSNVESFRGSLTFRIGDLPYDMWSVFSHSEFCNQPNTAILPVNKLISRKNELRDPDFLLGIKRDPRQTAFDRMRTAALHGLPGRGPLQVVPINSMWFEILDGNATAQVLMLVGWMNAPAQIVRT
jgi:hypothetical protein